jgi:hypothetical protein
MNAQHKIIVITTMIYFKVGIYRNVNTAITSTRSAKGTKL